MSRQKTSSAVRIALAQSDSDISACLGVLRELRPQIGNTGNFVAQIRRMQAHGYRLLAAWNGDRVLACAGYYITENLIRGRYLHVNELVTTRAARSGGIGQSLLQSLIEEARSEDCHALMLECGMGNPRAHGFYFREGMRITAFRFAVTFDQVPGGQ